jgi:multiple sugar transport system substrate-binding protein
MMPCGRVLAIAAQSKDPWKAYQVIHYLSVVTSLDDVSTPETGLDPYRYSHFAHPEAYEMFANVEDAKIYLAGVQKNMEKGYPEMVLPGTVEYEETLGVALTKALAGELDPKSALDEAAQAWRDILERFGKEQQKALYQELVKGWKAVGLW